MKLMKKQTAAIGSLFILLIALISLTSYPIRVSAVSEPDKQGFLPDEINETESVPSGGFILKFVPGQGPQADLNIYTDGDKVGIGTTSPNDKLNVIGNIRATGAICDNTGCIGAVGDNLGDHTATQNINLNGHWLSGNGTNTGLFVSEQGNIGLGLSNPGVRLDVDGSIIASGGSSTDWNTAFSWGDHSEAGYLTNESDPQVGVNSPNYVPIWNGSSLTSGAIYDIGAYIGIGTTNPSERLDVNGTVRATRFAGYGIVPVGSVIAWHKLLPGVPTLPDGWVECNGQTLNDPASPLHGQVIPNLNGPGLFIRGGLESGVQQADQMQSHTHTDLGHTHSIHDTNHDGTPANTDFSPGEYGYYFPDAGTTSVSHAILTDPVESSGGPARHGAETRPVNMSMVWIMRVK